MNLTKQVVCVCVCVYMLGGGHVHDLMYYRIVYGFRGHKGSFSDPLPVDDPEADKPQITPWYDRLLGNHGYSLRRLVQAWSIVEQSFTLPVN